MMAVQMLGRVCARTICLAAGLAAPASFALTCELPAQGEGRVAAVIDGRTVRLEDGREVRLAALELPARIEAQQRAVTTLASAAAGAIVTLRGISDAPDRYGRQTAFVWLQGATASIQETMLTEGMALVSPQADAACFSELSTAENAALAQKRGLWSDPAALKNTESPGDILAAIGQVGVVEGKVLSVRQAGGVTYVNFGRRWSEDFAITMSKRAVAAFEDAKIPVKSLENRRVRVRGWIGQRGGPRIEVFRVEQIRVLGENEPRLGRGRVPGG